MIKNSFLKLEGSEKVLSLIKASPHINGLDISNTTWSKSLSDTLRSRLGIRNLKLEKVRHFSLSLFLEVEHLQRLVLKGIGKEARFSAVLSKKKSGILVDIRSKDRGEGLEHVLHHLLKEVPQVTTLKIVKGAWNKACQKELNNSKSITHIELVDVNDFDFIQSRWRPETKKIRIEKLSGDPTLTAELHIVNGSLGIEVKGEKGNSYLSCAASSLIKQFPDVYAVKIRGGRWTGQLEKTFKALPLIEVLALDNVLLVNAFAVRKMKHIGKIFLTGEVFQENLSAISLAAKDEKIALYCRNLDWDKILKTLPEKKTKQQSFPKASLTKDVVLTVIRIGGAVFLNSSLFSVGTFATTVITLLGTTFDTWRP